MFSQISQLGACSTAGMTEALISVVERRKENPIDPLLCSMKGEEEAQVQGRFDALVFWGFFLRELPIRIKSQLRLHRHARPVRCKGLNEQGKLPPTLFKSSSFPPSDSIDTTGHTPAKEDYAAVDSQLVCGIIELA